MENNEDKPADNVTKPLHWKIKQKLEREAAAQVASASSFPVAESFTDPHGEHETVVQVSTEPVKELSEREKYNAEIARIRKTRKPYGAFQQKLALSLRSGYHRHWFNDVPGRVDEAKLSGWTHVEDKDGRPIKRVVGKGRDTGAMYAYAMEIPDVFWEEDLAESDKRARAPMDAIKGNSVQAKPGEAKPEDNSKFYSPREQILDIQRR